MTKTSEIIPGFLADEAKFTNLVDLLITRAHYQPKQKAYTFLQDSQIAEKIEEKSLTYFEIHTRAMAIGALLQSLEVTGERALLLYSPGLEFIAAFFGCLYAGVVPVPTNVPRRNQKTPISKVILRDSKAKIVLTTAEKLAKIASKHIKDPELESLHWFSTNDIKNDLAADWQRQKICQDSLAFLQYTSGSTGNPKGVMVSHANLLHNSKIIYKCFEHSPESHALVWLPHYHDMGLIGGIIQPLYGGFPSTLMSPISFIKKPYLWLQAISHYKVTTSGGPSFAYDLACKQITPEQISSLDLSSWTVAFNGAEFIREDAMRRFAATFAPCGFRWESFYPCYGMAEGTLLVSGGFKNSAPVIDFDEEISFKQEQSVNPENGNNNSKPIVSCGKNWQGQKIVIANPKLLTLCAEGQVGEIWVQGQSVTQGYWNRLEETEKTFDAYLNDTKEGPFLRTGDLGFLKNGELFVTGRIKEMIIIRGKNHYPQDIELTAQKAHISLETNSGAAFSIEVEGQERLVIAQEVKRTYIRKLNTCEVLSAIRRAILKHHGLQPYKILLLKPGRIPKTTSGKIQRCACKECFSNQSLNIIGEWTENIVQEDSSRSRSGLNIYLEQLKNLAGQSIFEKLSSSHQKQRIELLIAYLTDIVSELVSQENYIADPKRGFFDMGIDSLKIAELEARIQSDLDICLSATTFFEYSNIKELAKYLDSVIYCDIEQQKGEHIMEQINASNSNLPQTLTVPCSENEFQNLLKRQLEQLEVTLKEI